jgi:hypothetical protein
LKLAYKKLVYPSMSGGKNTEGKMSKITLLSHWLFGNRRKDEIDKSENCWYIGLSPAIKMKRNVLTS